MNTEKIDPQFVARIARLVIERLNTQDDPAIAGGVISAQTIKQYSGRKRITIPSDAVITPAAIDEAKELGITISRFAPTPSPQPPSIVQGTLVDRQPSQRTKAIAHQLRLRGITTHPTNIVLTDTPNTELINQCVAGQRAVLIRNISDVEKAYREVKPTSWVLDMTEMNIASATNTIAKLTTYTTETHR